MQCNLENIVFKLWYVKDTFTYFLEFRILFLFYYYFFHSATNTTTTTRRQLTGRYLLGKFPPTTTIWFI